MRCGPAYDLTGALSAGLPQNRVLLDGLPEAAPGFTLGPGGSPSVPLLVLERQLAEGRSLRLELPALAPGLS
jgi:hypothetical protein